jgi:enoyl-CoA hydratase/carnithine racemase
MNLESPVSRSPAAAEAPELLHASDSRGVHTITLNAPRSLNVLGESMLASLQSALDGVRDDPRARVVVLAATGKAFCAGHNLREMKARPELAYYQDLFARCSRLMLSIQKLPVPVIARVQAVAAAAGCQLVAQCDLAVAADTARFGVNGIDLGLFCSTPSVPLVRSIPPKKSLEMLLTGGFLDARQALECGLINRAVAEADLDQAVAGLVDAILDKPRDAVAMGKDLFYRQREMGIEAAYQLAGQTMACNLALDVAQEGVQAFIDKRPASWRA